MSKKNEHLVFYRSKSPTKMSYVFFGNYKDQTGKQHTYTDVIGVSEDQVIKWLKDNKDIFALLKNQLRGGGKVEMDLVEQKQAATSKKTKN